MEVEGPPGRRGHSQYCKIFCKNIAKYCKDIVKSSQNLEVEGRAGRRSHSQYWAHRGQLTSKHNGTRENGKTTNREQKNNQQKCKEILPVLAYPEQVNTTIKKEKIVSCHVGKTECAME